MQWYVHMYRRSFMHVTTSKHIFLHIDISIHPDIDECSDGTHDCSQTCTNTIASYTCGCNTGYLLETDGITCSGMCTCTDVHSCM